MRPPSHAYDLIAVLFVIKRMGANQPTHHLTLWATLVGSRDVTKERCAASHWAEQHPVADSKPGASPLSANP